jgi:hypothetical protein
MESPDIRVAAFTKRGLAMWDLWDLAAAVFFCTMGIFAGATALYVTSTPVNWLLGHQAAEIVLFCMFAIALFAVIAIV